MVICRLANPAQSSELVRLLEPQARDFTFLVEIEQRVHHFICEGGAIPQFHTLITLLPLMQSEFLERA
jgi:hypothetical protein